MSGLVREEKKRPGGGSGKQLYTLTTLPLPRFAMSTLDEEERREIPPYRAT